MRLPHRATLWLGLALACATLPRIGNAQGLPAYAPVNPIAASRSGVYFQPLVPSGPGWRTWVSLDYASTIEINLGPPDTLFLLDSELARLDLAVARDLGPRWFALAEASVNAAYGGVLDGFLNWYHGLLGIEVPERETGPDNAFRYDVVLPDGRAVRRASATPYLGDLRLALGRRHGSVAQTVLALTLPTATGPEGYGRGTGSVSLLTTARAAVVKDLVYEGSLGLGYTPASGALAEIQRTTFLAASSGLRWRFWGRLSAFGNLFYHSPYYDRSFLPALDRRELSFDFGWALATAGGTEWRIGMTEDPEPSGPGIDLVFRLGARF